MRVELIESLAVIAVSAIGLHDAWRLARALRGGGAYHGVMGPDAYLAAVATALLVCGAAALVKACRMPAAAPAGHAAGSSPQVRQVALVVAVLVAYVAAFPLLGYLLATLLFFPVAFFVFGVRPWTRSVAVGVVLAAAFYVLFAHVAELPLPKGLLDFGA